MVRCYDLLTIKSNIHLLKTGPGTKLRERLARGDTGINPLDSACKEHDIAYSQNKDLEARHAADRVLQEKAWQRVKAKDSGLGEKAAALFVTGAMKTKRALGMGIRKRKGRKRAAALSAMKTKLGMGKKRTAKKKRVIKAPKFGGFIFSIPLILGALGALGSLGGGAAAIAKSVNDAKANAQTLAETQRHNKAMENLASGKGIYLPYRKKIRGKGLYLRPMKKGLGLFLNPKNYR